MSKIKLYTKKGDKGTTSLCGSRNISKASNVMSVLGDIDELSASLGLVSAFMTTSTHDQKVYAMMIHAELRRIQLILLDIGSNIATTKGEKPTHVTEQEIKQVEGWIDRLEESNIPLREFILPGKLPVDAQLHFTRAVCRRLERSIVLYTNETQVDTNILKYINRLSDYFFALARFLCNCQEITRSKAQEMFSKLSMK